MQHDSIDGQPKEEAPDEIRTITPKAVMDWVLRGRTMHVLDVREAAEIERCRRRVYGAIEVPVHQIFLRRSELPQATSELIVTISTHSERARAAAFTLHMLGYTNVRVFEGGIERWTETGLPTG